MLFRSGKFRDHGRIRDVNQCIDICCLNQSCDLAFILKDNCFSVSCYNKKLCQFIKAKSSDDQPKLIYIYGRTNKNIKEVKKRKIQRRSNVLLAKNMGSEMLPRPQQGLKKRSGS